MQKAILLIISLIFCTAQQAFAQQETTYIKAGFLYNSEQNTLQKNKVIAVKGNKIVSIGDYSTIPQNSKTIDLTAYTVLPGLIDAHTHVLFSQDANQDFAEHSMQMLTMESEALRTLRGSKRAKSYLDVGITSIKDLGNSGLFLDVALRDAINEGTIVGPRIFASGPIISATGGQIYGVNPAHQHLIDLEYRIIKSEADARNAVREHVNQKVDLIKIATDNIPNNSALSVAEMKSIVKTAHASGLTVTAHSITNQSAYNAIQAGVDGIEHGFNLADSTLTLMAKKNVFLVPTENSRAYSLIYNKLAGFDETDVEWIDNYLQRMKDRLKRAIAKGVTIIAGSDNYTDIEVTRGNSSKDMFRAYFEMRMKPLDILQSATYLSALHFNKENEIGVLKPNAYADIIAVKGSLTNDFLETLSNVVFVMKDGEVYVEKFN
ncbi:amidohydrolase family protein [Aequorivita capsosiphonis]|uniref:amidohydrolase family protein n=1 Tax=Aequorivita capsosiphonis TaxID=487317 RepID=UPI000408686C|nr:amidohydrolase family protein [Aequorivita capsosiphonis]